MEKNNDYWVRRAEQLEDAQHNKGVRFNSKLKKQYKQAEQAIQKDIDAWYSRFALNNEISLQEARKLLTKNELEEFHWNVMDYIAKGRENAISHAWEKQLENASAKWHISRLEALKIQMQNHVEFLYDGEQLSMADFLTDVYTDNYYHTAYEIQKGFNVGYDLMRLDEDKIQKVLSKPWAADGSNFSSRIWKHKAQLVSELHNGLTQSIIRGQSPQALTKHIAERFKVSEGQAARLVMTETAFIQSASTRDCYKEMGVEQYEFVATLDSRTSELCQSLDGKVLPMAQYEVGVTAPPVHCWCFDKETEVYTSDGWKLFAELNGTEEVWTLDKETLIPEWQKPMNYIAYRYTGKMMHFQNDRTDIVVTPNHRMLVQNMDSSVKDKSYKLRRADSIGLTSKNRMLAGCEWEGQKEQTAILGGREVDIETYLKFMAYWLADGSCTPDRGSYNIKIAQCDNDWMYEELSKLPYNIYKGKEALMIHDKTLGEELIKYGKCTDKYIPELIKGLSSELIEIFLYAYAKTDGTVKKGKLWKGYHFSDSITFYSTSKAIADGLGELIMKVGGRPSFRLDKRTGREVEFKNGTYALNYDCWAVYWNKQIHSWINNMNVTELDYDDMVYCLEVERHNTLLVRRNGKVLWSGNCRSTTAPYFDDEFELNAERAARKDDGEIYYVPASMKYPEWKKAFVDGGSKDGLTVLTAGAVAKEIALSNEKDIENNAKSGKVEIGKGIDSEIKDKNGNNVVNPNYDKDISYQANCGNCSVAYEMRRRGLDVEANPSAGMLVEEWEELFVGATMEFLKTKKGIPYVETLSERLLQYGDGARGSVFVRWKAIHQGHFFSWEVENGKVRFIDAQDGTLDAASYFENAAGTSIRFVRWDNLEPSEQAKKAYKERGK